MKKYLLITGVILAPWSVRAADIQTYVAAVCNGSYSDSTVRTFCETLTGSSWCSSGGMMLPHVYNGTSYKAYSSCIVVKVANSGDDPYLLCFIDGNVCTTLSNGCTEGYKGDVPVVTLDTIYPSVNQLVKFTNYAQFQCCAGGACSGYKYMTNSYLPTGKMYFSTNSCNSADGTCGSKSNGYGVACDIGYYDKSGLGWSNGASSSLRPDKINTKMECISCKEATGYDNATTSGYGTAKAITDCYLPTGSTNCHEPGCFTVTNPCYYSE